MPPKVEPRDPARATRIGIIGPTLPLPEMTPEALGVKELPPEVMMMNSNRAWSFKPGLLQSLVNLSRALKTELHLDQNTALMLKLVTSALNQCLY